MPYKDPERKRRWEREHRAQRNARRRLQRPPARSGRASVSKAEPDPISVLVARLKKRDPKAATATRTSATKPTSDIVAALRNLRRPAPAPVPDQKPQGTWKAILGWAVGIGVVLLAAVASVNPPTPSGLGPSPRLGN